MRDMSNRRIPELLLAGFAVIVQGSGFRRSQTDTQHHPLKEITVKDLKKHALYFGIIYDNIFERHL